MMQLFLWIMMAYLLAIGIISFVSEGEEWVGIQVTSMIGLVVGISVIYVVS
jgi:hypothetical protein